MMLSIRRATAHDAGLLTKLNEPIQRQHSEARPEMFKLPVRHDEARILWYQNILNQPENYVYIGEVNDLSIGYVIAQIVHRQETPFTYSMKWILIDQLSVNPEHQGKGYGKMLIQTVRNLARMENINRVVLDVWSFNRHASEFYCRQGFEVYNERLELFWG